MRRYDKRYTTVHSEEFFERRLAEVAPYWQEHLFDGTLLADVVRKIRSTRGKLKGELGGSSPWRRRTMYKILQWFKDRGFQYVGDAGDCRDYGKAIIHFLYGGEAHPGMKILILQDKTVQFVEVFFCGPDSPVNISTRAGDVNSLEKMEEFLELDLAAPARTA